jgi:TPP-dependent pyruvate/acetoin dehydrogenase alpha subunit
LLQARGLFTDADQAKVEAGIQDEIKQAIAVAEAAPPPALATMFDDVYKEAPWHLREQCEYLMRSPRPMKR